MALDPVLPWHVDAWSQVISQQHHQRLAHAYLISGLAGSGRYQFARALTASMLCATPAAARQASGEMNALACGRCRQCQLLESGNHPDVLDIAPDEGKNSIKIEQIRTISRLVNQTSNQAGAIKVIIIQPAEALGQAAANALLKNLEEPPGRTLFLLISGPASQLLPTIRSRCQPLPLPPASAEQGLNWLAAHCSASKDELNAALALAAGAPLHALSLLEAGIPAWQSIVHEQLAAMAEGRVSPLDVAKYCNAQPLDYAIQLMQELSLQRAREALLAQKPAKAKAFLGVGRELIQVNRQVKSGANPNSLMALEHIFSTWHSTA